MADLSQIEWTDATWNRWFGCIKTSAGCINCYIERTPPARMNGWVFNRAGIGGHTPIVMAEERRLYFPLRKRKPLKIFVNSLSDMWLPAPQIDTRREIAEMFAVMLLCRWHIFQIFTKRSNRQQAVLSNPNFVAWVRAALERVIERSPQHGGPKIYQDVIDRARAHLALSGPGEALVPLPNVWLGVTVEEEKTTSRIADLQATPAAVRMLSCEPITGHFRLAGRLAGIDWVIIGGESGPPARAGADDTETSPARPGLRTLDLDHVAELTSDCRGAGVAVFVKQLGEPWAKSSGASHRKGGDMAEWPKHLQIREYPQLVAA